MKDRHEVTNIILTANSLDKHKIGVLNTMGWYNTERGLVSCHHDGASYDGYVWYGGNKCLERQIWIGAFSTLEIDKLLTAMRLTAFHEPECVRLYVCAPSEVRFTRIDWMKGAST